MKKFFKELSQDLYKSLVIDSMWYNVREVYRSDVKLKALNMFLIFLTNFFAQFLVFVGIFILIIICVAFSSVVVTLPMALLFILFMSLILTIETVVVFELLGVIIYVIDKYIDRRKKNKIKWKQNGM